MKLSAPIFRLKRRAKLLSREARIPLAEALNRIAEQEGFRSWSLLAALWAKRAPAPEIFAQLSSGDMLLVGARPMQGKTILALGILAEAHRAGRFGAYFTLEHTTAEAGEALRSVGVDPASADILVDTSDAISADHIISKLRGVKPDAVIVVDYLQALDHSREKPPLSQQISVLKAFARDAKLIFVFISQIDRRYDASSKALPDVADVRLPNRIDTSVFSKTCFLRDGELVFGDGGVAP